MASLTLKGIPEEVIQRLRDLAEQQRRSINQQAILILEHALLPPRPGFGEAYDAFSEERGASPLDNADLVALRSTDTGRRVAL